MKKKNSKLDVAVSSESLSLVSGLRARRAFRAQYRKFETEVFLMESDFELL